jgi:hypothetical protein
MCSQHARPNTLFDEPFILCLLQRPSPTAHCLRAPQTSPEHSLPSFHSHQATLISHCLSPNSLVITSIRTPRRRYSASTGKVSRSYSANRRSNFSASSFLSRTHATYLVFALAMVTRSDKTTSGLEATFTPPASGGSC